MAEREILYFGFCFFEKYSTILQSWILKQKPKQFQKFGIRFQIFAVQEKNLCKSLIGLLFNKE